MLIFQGIITKMEKALSWGMRKKEAAGSVFPPLSN
jgi:hypothetical protein